LLEFFLDGIEGDRFVSTHLYGDIFKVAHDNPENTVNESILLKDVVNLSAYLKQPGQDTTLNQTTIKQINALDKQVARVKKMNETETFIAIMKGYCGAVILFTAKAFGNGGWLYSSLSFVVSGYFTTVCAKKLVECGLKYNCYSYSLIAKKAYGDGGKIFLDLMVVLSQYSFAIT
jgi:hypothetical protein